MSSFASLASIASAVVENRLLAQAKLGASMQHDEASDGILRFPMGIDSVAHALEARAERFLDLHPGTESALRRLFTLRLAHVPKQGEPVRRRAAKAECTSEEWTLAQELASADWRLLTIADEVGAPTVEVAHEALLRNWPKLTGWLGVAQEFLIWKGQLETARREWGAAPSDKKDGAVLMGLSLENARHWRDERGEDLTQADTGFIDRSIALEEARKAEEARRRQELEDERTRSEKRRRWITRLSAAAAIVFAVLGGVAAWQWKDAVGARNDAEGAKTQAIEALAAEEQARAAADDAAEQARLGSRSDYGHIAGIRR